MKKFLIAAAVLAGTMTNALAMSSIEEGYVKDSLHSLYAHVLNENCHYVPYNVTRDLEAEIEQFAYNTVGSSAVRDYNNKTGKMSQIFVISDQLKNTNANMLKSICRSHRAEFNKIFKYLKSLNDESNESEDD